MNKGLPTVFYSCQVYSLNLIIEVRISDYFIFISYLLFYIILFYAVGFFLIVVKYIKFAVLAIFMCMVRWH